MFMIGINNNYKTWVINDQYMEVPTFQVLACPKDILTACAANL
jgi:hypothetical protein